MKNLFDVGAKLFSIGLITEIIQWLCVHDNSIVDQYIHLIELCNGYVKK
ncbi:MAG: hypothetical protein ABI045_06580 [Flavobacteriales bacterium]